MFEPLLWSCSPRTGKGPLVLFQDPMDLTEFELNALSPRELRTMAERLSLPPLRRDLLIAHILASQGERKERIRWWDAMRRLRSLKRFEGDWDCYVVECAESASHKAPGTATADDLERLLALEAGEEGDQASSVERLTRSEVLTELGRHRRHRGESHREILESWGYLPTTEELTDYLGHLGGPSSSSPERVAYDVASGLERLGRTEAFGRLENQEIFDRVVLDQEYYAITDVDEAARCADVMEEGERIAKRSPVALVSGLRRKYPGLTDQEMVEVVEGAGGPAGLEEARRVLGISPPEDAPPPLKDFRWWDAMRKVRTIPSYGLLRDGELEGKSQDRYHGVEPGRVTPTNLYRLYDNNKSKGGVGPRALVPSRLTRGEVLAELSKFPWYEGVERIDEAIPREGSVATTEELRSHLDLLGGPSSSSPEAPGGWWGAMRNLRTLEKFQAMRDDEIVGRVEEPTTEGLRDLFGRERVGGRSSDVAKVPRKLSRKEIFEEFAKLGVPPERRHRRMSDEELMALLNLRGGPSSA